MEFVTNFFKLTFNNDMRKKLKYWKKRGDIKESSQKNDRKA